MITGTSLEAFEKILPKIGERQLLVLEHLGWVVDGTDAMICQALKLPINCVTPRRNELVKMGCICKERIAKCLRTSGTATYWKITPKGKEVIEFRKNKMEEIYDN